MAVIRVKRGTTKPTTTSLSHVGELAFDYSSNSLYARSSSEVVKIGGELEQVYRYEGVGSNLSVTYSFHQDYIYRIVVIASTNGKTLDTSTTYINYRTNTLSNLTGSYLAYYTNDALTTLVKSSAVGITVFQVPDAHSNGIGLTSGISKTIDFQLAPIFSTGFGDVRQWVAYGKKYHNSHWSNERNLNNDRLYSFNEWLT